MPEVRFDTYYRYDELQRLLEQFAAEYPELMRLESIGDSYEGRTIWLATVTNFATGPDREKPALWVDGNIHASEVSPSSACLHHLERLLTQYGQEEDITRCLDTRVFYICPRINPDGAEWALADKPKIIRSSTRPYPYDEEPIEGLRVEDVDGDGRMLQMRVRDQNGAWKVSEADGRLMTRRGPTEVGGQYYRVLPEGRIDNYDGVLVRMQKVKEGLDLNRNFPLGWRHEGEQRGAGPYPTSEPEVRAVVQFIAGHPNITGGITFHTYSGVLLRPHDTQPDDAFPAEDLWTYQFLGRQGTEMTGYPNISVYHDFRYHPKEVITGAFDEWLYEQLGIFSWTVELWSPQRQAGIDEYKYIDWYRDHPVEDDLKLLRWSDEKLGGKGFIDWYAYEHPELGPVELGGWNNLYAWRNPPLEYLEKEIAPFSRWLTWHLLISPRLELVEASAKPLGQGTYRVRMVVQNTGWLPSYVTKKALENKTSRPVVCEIELPDGATLESGRKREEAGQLEGRAYKGPSPTGWASIDQSDDRLKLDWTVHAPAGGTIRLVARHDRAGTVRADVVLE